MVLQETWLKQGTIHDNIAFGNPEASRETGDAAAKQPMQTFSSTVTTGILIPSWKNAGESLSVGQAQLFDHSPSLSS